jgi:sugar lactone lactonase YvrE
MPNTVMLQRISPPFSKVFGLALVNGKVWVAAAGRNRIRDGEIGPRGEYQAKADIVSKVKNPAGLAWDGKKLYFADRFNKTIFRTTSSGEETELVLSLKELKSLDKPLVFLIESSEVTSLTWGKGLLWFACKAGYSSSFYAIDLSRKKIVRHFRAQGPEPEGISFDKQEEFIWTLDARNEDLIKFTAEGQWTGVTLPAHVENPTGLTLDEKDNFWTYDQKAGKLCQIKQEVE